MSFRNLTILKAHFAKFHSQLSEEQVAIEPDVGDLKEREGLKECSILVEKMTERDLEQFQSVRDKVVKEEIVEEDGEETPNRMFYLADTEAIVGPCIVVPDIGGDSNAYFQW